MTAGTPARRYSWAPFAPGHELSTTHGAKSRRKVSPIAVQIEAELLAVAPWANLPAFSPTLAALAWTEAQLVLVRAYIDEHGPLDDAGVPRPALTTLAEIERRADRLRAQFGLSPSTWSALHRSVAVYPEAGGGESAVEALRAIGAELLDATATEHDEREDDE